MQKKQLEWGFIHQNTLRKILQFMKLTFVFTVLFCLQVSAELHSQTKLTIHLKNASFSEVFLAIEKKPVIGLFLITIYYRNRKILLFMPMKKKPPVFYQGFCRILLLAIR